MRAMERGPLPPLLAVWGTARTKYAAGQLDAKDRGRMIIGEGSRDD